MGEITHGVSIKEAKLMRRESDKRSTSNIKLVAKPNQLTVNDNDIESEIEGDTKMRISVSPKLTYKFKLKENEKQITSTPTKGSTGNDSLSVNRHRSSVQLTPRSPYGSIENLTDIDVTLVTNLSVCDNNDIETDPDIKSDLSPESDSSQPKNATIKYIVGTMDRSDLKVQSNGSASMNNEPNFASVTAVKDTRNNSSMSGMKSNDFNFESKVSNTSSNATSSHSRSDSWDALDNENFSGRTDKDTKSTKEIQASKILKQGSRDRVSEDILDFTVIESYESAPSTDSQRGHGVNVIGGGQNGGQDKDESKYQVNGKEELNEQSSSKIIGKLKVCTCMGVGIRILAQ